MTPHFFPLRKNRYVRFGFGGSTVLLGSSGDQVSFNTTVGGGDVLLKDNCERFY
jgi:phosphatidylserine decarboxylase